MVDAELRQRTWTSSLAKPAQRDTVKRPDLDMGSQNHLYPAAGRNLLSGTAVLDAHSRKVVGWYLCDEINDWLTLEALEMSLKDRNPPKGSTHHSDRVFITPAGAMWTGYRTAGAWISMASRGALRENANAESFSRTLKMEEVYLQDRQGYATIGGARRSIRRFNHVVCNQKRLHSSPVTAAGRV